MPERECLPLDQTAADVVTAQAGKDPRAGCLPASRTTVTAILFAKCSAVCSPPLSTLVQR